MKSPWWESNSLQSTVFKVSQDCTKYCFKLRPISLREGDQKEKKWNRFSISEPGPAASPRHGPCQQNTNSSFWINYRESWDAGEMIQRVASSSSSSRLEKQRKEIQHRVVNYREDPRLGPGTGPVLTFDYIVNSSPQTQSRVYSEMCGEEQGKRD